MPLSKRHICVATVLVGLSAGSVQAVVIGDDDRRSAPSKFSDFALSVGAVRIAGSREGCSAFCVKDRLVATAAHCLAGKPLDKTEIVFRRGGRDLERSPIAGSELSQATQNVVLGLNRLQRTPPVNAADDWALVRLEEPVCRGHTYPVFDVSTLGRGLNTKEAFSLAIHGDKRPGLVSVSGPCRAVAPRSLASSFTEPSRTLLHECDAGKGASGGPVIFDGPRGLSVIGIHTGSFRVRDAEGKTTVLWNSGTWARSFLDLVSHVSAVAVIEEQDDLDKLRAKLIGAGRSDVIETGPFDANLRRAIAAYQQSKGLPVTGLPELRLIDRERARKRKRRKRRRKSR